MFNLISRLFEALLRALFPSGTHRRPKPTDTYKHTRLVSAGRRRLVVCRSVVVLVPGRFPPLRGEDSALVRPYVRAEFEPWEHAEEQLRRQRRRALWLAVHGIDVGPRVIHGVVVA